MRSDQRKQLRRRVGRICVVALLLGASCGSTPTSAPAAVDQPVTTEPAAAPATSVPTTTLATATAAPAAALDQIADQDLAGESFGLAPAAGSPLAVVGVKPGSDLNIRARPGVSSEVVTSAPALSQNVIATGRDRLLSGVSSNALWFEVTSAQITGWASASYLAYLGRTSDSAPRFIAAGETFDSTDAIITTLQAANSSGTTTLTGGPTTVGASQIITVDLLGFEDDSVAGNRLQITGEPGPRNTFVVTAVTSTLLCRRGVAAGSGFCT